MKQVLLTLVFALSSTFANANESTTDKCTIHYAMHPGPVVETSIAEAQKTGTITIKYMSGSGNSLATVIAKSVHEGDGSVVLFGVVLAKEVCPDSFSIPSESETQVTVAISEFSGEIKGFRVLN